MLNTQFCSAKLEVTTKFQYTYPEAIDITDPADTYYRDQIPYIPWHSGSAILALFYKGWGAQLQLHLHGPKRQPAGEHPAQPHPAVVYERPLATKRRSRYAPEPLKASAEVKQSFSGQGLRRGAQLSDAEDQLRFVVSVDL